MRIYLKKVTLEDGQMIVKWRNNPKVSNHCFNRTPLTLESNKAFFENYVLTGKYLQYIVERVDDQYGVASYPIATIYLKDIDRTNHRCELCIFTSDDEEWNDESKSIAIKMLLNEAFNNLDMNKVYSYVFIEFLDEADMLKNAGFKAEAILSEEAVNSRGNYSDVIRFSIKKADYEKAINDIQS